MKFQKGNKYWQQRKKHGKGKAIKSPTVLWELACDYFQRCDDTPWNRVDFRGKDVIEVNIPVQRPYTWTGFEDFLFEKGIISVIDQYKENRDGRYGDYVDIITRIDKIIYTQKFEGAVVGAYNANIIARDLGLTDKKEIKTPDIKPTKYKVIGRDGD